MPGEQPGSGPITPQQMRAARSLLGWSMQHLARVSTTTTGFVYGFEKGGRLSRFLSRPLDFDCLAAIRTALEAAGIEIMDGDQPGVRLTKVADQVAKPPQVTPQQMLAARSLLGWSRERLAAWSDTTAPFISTYENDGRVANLLSRGQDFDGLASISAALEAAGVEFIEESGGGPGVRLREPPA